MNVSGKGGELRVGGGGSGERRWEGREGEVRVDGEGVVRGGGKGGEGRWGGERR